MSAIAFKKPKIYVPPLFERISLKSPEALDEDELKESITQEVSVVLNARLGILISEEEKEYPHPYPLFFGLEDFSSPDMDRSSEVKRKIKRLINLYEPRLKKVQVVSVEYVSSTNTMLVFVKGVCEALGTPSFMLDFSVDVRLS